MHFFNQSNDIKHNQRTECKISIKIVEICLCFFHVLHIILVKKILTLKMRFSLGVTRMDKIRNESVRGTAHVLETNAGKQISHIQKRNGHSVDRH